MAYTTWTPGDFFRIDESYGHCPDPNDTICIGVVQSADEDRVAAGIVFEYAKDMPPEAIGKLSGAKTLLCAFCLPIADHEVPEGLRAQFETLRNAFQPE